MPDHVGKQIIDQVRVVLNSLTTTVSNVFVGRVHHLPKNKLPAVLIYAGVDDEEDDTKQGDGNHAKFHEFIVQVEAIVKNSDPEVAEGTLWTIRNEVQKAIEADTTLGGLCKDISLRRTEPERSGEGDQPHAAFIMDWRVFYRNKETVPDVVLD